MPACALSWREKDVRLVPCRPLERGEDVLLDICVHPLFSIFRTPIPPSLSKSVERRKKFMKQKCASKPCTKKRNE